MSILRAQFGRCIVGLALLATLAVTNVLPAAFADEPSSRPPSIQRAGSPIQHNAELVAAITKARVDLLNYATALEAAQQQATVVHQSTAARNSSSGWTSSAAVNYDPDSIQGIICSVFGDSCAHAIAIARCESNLNPNAQNRSGASGLFQLLNHGDMFEAHGWSADDWPDPYKNTVVAYDLSRGGTSWSAWQCRA